MAVIPEHEVPDEVLDEVSALVDQYPMWGAEFLPVPSCALARASLDAYRAANPPTPEAPEVGSWWTDQHEVFRVVAVDVDQSVLYRRHGRDGAISEQAYCSSPVDFTAAFVPSSPPAGWEETP
jgi:hypothetical protein